MAKRKLDKNKNKGTTAYDQMFYERLVDLESKLFRLLIFTLMILTILIVVLILVVVNNNGIEKIENNLHKNNLDCERWGCSYRGYDYNMDNVDTKHCGGYLTVSTKRWEAICLT